MKAKQAVKTTKKGKTGNKTRRMTTPPVPTPEELTAVDTMLRCWTHAASAVPGRDDVTGSVNGIPTLYVGDFLPAVARALRTLAHCAQMVYLQDLATGRKSSNVSGPHGDVRGFVRAVILLERLAAHKALALQHVTPPTEDDIVKAWNEIEKSREHVVTDVEAAAPGWYALAQEKIREERETFKEAVARAKKRKPCGKADPLAPWTHKPKKGFAERIARNKAKCFAKGKPPKEPKRGGFKPEDFGGGVS